MREGYTIIADDWMLLSSENVTQSNSSSFRDETLTTYKTLTSLFSSLANHLQVIRGPPHGGADFVWFSGLSHVPVVPFYSFHPVCLLLVDRTVAGRGPSSLKNEKKRESKGGGEGREYQEGQELGIKRQTDGRTDGLRLKKE